MLRVSSFVLPLAFLGLSLPATLWAQSEGAFGIRAGAGADISGGVAYGGQIDYTLPRGANAFELGLVGFGGKFTEDRTEGIHDYTEESKLFVVAAIANYLFRHSPAGSGPYFVGGAGVGAFSVEWREESPTDPSLGTPLPDGGTFQVEDATTSGFILNFGIGHRFNEQYDIRAQVPTFFIGSGTNRGDKVIPTFTLTVGIGF